jgi:hypothetical protein
MESFYMYVHIFHVWSQNTALFSFLLLYLISLIYHVRKHMKKIGLHIDM